MQKGLLLVNLGTPRSAGYGDVFRFLNEFLCDRRVIDLPYLMRHLLVKGVIIPSRLLRVVHAYRSIQDCDGQLPLRVYGERLKEAIASILEIKVVHALRYGEGYTSLEDLKDCDEITVIPLFPQYASATTGSVLEWVLRYFMLQEKIPSLRIWSDFYAEDFYIESYARLIRLFMRDNSFVLMSYHGLPMRHIERVCHGTVCRSSESCPEIGDDNRWCYRAQCYASSKRIAQALNLLPDRYTTVFQSRLGALPWTSPDIISGVKQCAQSGVEHLVVVCPSFMVDCLETIDEIGGELKKLWLSLGGKTFALVPCLNSHDFFVRSLCDVLNR